MLYDDDTNHPPYRAIATADGWSPDGVTPPSGDDRAAVVAAVNAQPGQGPKWVQAWMASRTGRHVDLDQVRLVMREMGRF